METEDIYHPFIPVSTSFTSTSNISANLIRLKDFLFVTVKKMFSPQEKFIS